MKLNEFDLNKLHVFRIVAASASMREAGEKLLRTPSAVSQSISSLEHSLKVKLFRRSGIRLEITEIGARLLEQIKENERGLANIFNEALTQTSQVSGRVTLGMPPGYPAVSLSGNLGATLLEHADLQLRLRFLSHARLAEDLQKNQIEIAVSFQPLRQWDRKIKSVSLREENLVLAIPATLRHLTAGAVKELPVVDYYQKPLLIEGWLKHHRLKKGKPKIRVFGSNLDHVLQMVLQGIGCAVVPRHVVTQELAAGHLLEHSLDKRHPWIASVWLNAICRPEELPPGARSIWNSLLSR